jgi:hypothetical protein
MRYPHMGILQTILGRETVAVASWRCAAPYQAHGIPAVPLLGRIHQRCRRARSRHVEDFILARTLPNQLLNNNPKFIVSLLKAWFGDGD